MRLAEALIEKKDLQARIGELQNRYTASAVIEDGENADETPADLLRSLENAMERMEDLTVSINLANNRVFLPLVDEHTGVTLTDEYLQKHPRATATASTMMEGIAHRDNLKMRIGQYNGILNSIQQRNRNRRYAGENAPKMVVTEGVEASHFIKLVDRLGKELRLLDASIQATNWANDL